MKLGMIAGPVSGAPGRRGLHRAERPCKGRDVLSDRAACARGERSCGAPAATPLGRSWLTAPSPVRAAAVKSGIRRPEGRSEAEGLDGRCRAGHIAPQEGLTTPKQRVETASSARLLFARGGDRGAGCRVASRNSCEAWS